MYNHHHVCSVQSLQVFESLSGEFSLTQVVGSGFKNRYLV